MHPLAAPGEPRKRRKGEETRAQILETALQLFRERGYEETTMRAIAEAAGVSLGNAYYYFKSKRSTPAPTRSMWPPAGGCWSRSAACGSAFSG
jgi:hypothetical protein